MSYVDYEKAQKAGLKAQKVALSKGESEYLPVLDEILNGVDIVGEVSLGLVQIPLDSVVGTSNVGRTYAFANNFMPILDYKTEFGAKWSSLYESHIEEGIREPIKVYEYMNKFYVVEGNKRVSVLKYCGAVTVPAQVTRKIPKLTEDLQVKIYYEFMEFYKLNEINYLWFSQEGGFKKMLELTCQDPEAKWTEDQIKDFGSAHHNFVTALNKTEGKKLPLTSGDAFLIFIDIYGYEEIKNLTANEMKEKLDPLMGEFLMESKGGEVQLKTEPVATGRKKLVNYIWNPGPKKIMVAFVFDKDPGESEWLYAHELGRLYLEEHCGDNIKTLKVHNINSEEEAVVAMSDLIDMGVNVIFTTSAQQVSASLKVAAEHKDVIILNCSLNTSHKLIRTYYARLYEVKFLAGMLAGALSESGNIGYIADYPIVGTPANINAFALGAQMVNPRAKVFLEWTKVKGVSREKAIEGFKEKGVEYVSDQVMIKPNEASKQFGLYSISEDEPVNVAMPMYLWGPFYSKLIDSVMSGTFKQENEDSADKAINYWWGLSAGVVDLIYSRKIPEGTKKLVHVIKQQIIDNEFTPFQDEIKSQGGIIKNENGYRMSPEEIMKMNWLVENVEGEIPEIDDLREEAKSIVSLKGVSETEEVQ
ncbi:MAG: BMP family ABC transporter substrate-binding protein [Lachnospiraceae bacterium]|nr:BMP family ABC transporter substrate-binding protein [Lachnospiraceae bacterium]